MSNVTAPATTLLTVWKTATPTIACNQQASSVDTNSLRDSIIFGVLATVLGVIATAVALATFYARHYRSKREHSADKSDDLKNNFTVIDKDVSRAVADENSDSKDLKLGSIARYDASLVPSHQSFTKLCSAYERTRWALPRL